MTEEQAPRLKLKLPRRRTLAFGAIGIGTVAGMIGLIALRDPVPPAPRFAVKADDAPPAAATLRDPLMAELLSCRSLPAGSTDAACEEAWEVNRRRFLGESRSYVPSSAAVPSPASAPPIGER